MARKGSGIDPELQAPVPLVKNRGRPADPRRKRPVKKGRCERHGVTELAKYSRGPGRGYRWCCKRCAVCGYDRCIVNLGFHHVDPKTKAFQMSMRTGRSLAAFREEAKKCVLVCANCHGEIEAGLIQSPPAGATYATWGALRDWSERKAA
jgi:hypothetical protein